jgi:thiol-disulfide isomerase/thioredoxin
MKTKFIIFIQLLLTGYGFSQSIDPSALHLLQTSYDRLVTMKTISYRLNMVDTMVRANNFSVRWSAVRGTIKKDAYWHLIINGKQEWLVRGDTLYKKENPKIESATFTTDWDRHKIGSASIYNILGTTRPALNKNISSLQFSKDTSANDFYVIDECYKNTANETAEKDSAIHYSRIFINKKSLFAYRRIKYAKWFDEGETAVDIYDFTASLDTNLILFNPASFFINPPIKETDRFTPLTTGTKAPSFKARDVKTGQTFSIEELKGKVVVLDFWFLSCAPCRELMPKLQKLHEKFGKKNVVFIGVNVRDSEPKAIMHFLNEKRISYPQFYQPGQLLASDYKLQGFPTTLVLGKDGKVKLVETGLAENTELKLEQAIRKELEAKSHKY